MAQCKTDALPPLPAEWQAGLRPTHALLGLFMLLLAAGFIAEGVGAAAGVSSADRELATIPTSYAWAGFALVVGLHLGLLSMTPLLTSLVRRRPHTWRVNSGWVARRGEHGVVVDYLGRARAQGVALMVGAPLFAVVVVVVPFSGATAFGDGELFIPWLTSALLVAAAVWQLVDTRRGWNVRGWLALTPEGVTHRNHAMEAFVPWDLVGYVAVEEVGSQGPKVPVILLAVPGESHTHIVQHAKHGLESQFAPHVAMRPAVLGIDPGALYHALRFYHEHPEARGELASDAGLRRLQRGEARVGDVP